MEDIPSIIEQTYGKRIRLRVCGICAEQERVLMVRHSGLSPLGYFIAPPGGGLAFGEDVISCLQREFREETHLEISVKEFLFVHEFVQDPLHAVELFFLVEATGGSLQLGKDPETGSRQLLEAVRYMSFEAIRQERGPQLHAMFHQVSSLKELIQLRGYFKFDNKKRY